MDSVKPPDIVATMIQAGAAKAQLGPFDLLVRGFLSGALLGFATSLALGADSADRPADRRRGDLPGRLRHDRLARAGTGDRQLRLLPLAALRQQATLGTVLANWSWVFLGNLIGSMFYALLLVIALTDAWRIEPAGLAAFLIKAAEAKTIGYAQFGAAGMLTVFVKAILCNWMVCFGVVMAMSSTSTIGRIAGAWMPILMFFAQGFEHSVVNMFVIPAGMLLGAKVSLVQMVGVEPDPRHARQPGRRPAVHRPGAVRHLWPHRPRRRSLAGRRGDRG